LKYCCCTEKKFNNTRLTEMRNQLFLIIFSLSEFIIAEERLSWFTRDREMKRRIFVPDNLSEGKEENRVMPWVFHDNEEYKKMELKCIMRGYNVSNNPSDYKNARWSHPGFRKDQVDTSALPLTGKEGAVPYAIWTIEITTSAADAGKKWATCEFQQGDFPLSTDFKFLIFRKKDSFPGNEDVVYDLGGYLDERDLTQQVEDDIKRQISEHYDMQPESVTRYGQEFHIAVNKVSTKPTSEQKCYYCKWVKKCIYQDWYTRCCTKSLDVYECEYICDYAFPRTQNNF